MKWMLSTDGFVTRMRVTRHDINEKCWCSVIGVVGDAHITAVAQLPLFFRVHNHGEYSDLLVVIVHLCDFIIESYPKIFCVVHLHYAIIFGKVFFQFLNIVIDFFNVITMGSEVVHFSGEKAMN